MASPNNPIFATLTFPVGGAITVTFVVTNNVSGVVYFSLDETEPNSAVNALQVTLEPVRDFLTVFSRVVKLSFFQRTTRESFIGWREIV